jgi:ABC-type polysaccharide/polyol phosphate export permease
MKQSASSLSAVGSGALQPGDEGHHIEVRRERLRDQVREMVTELVGARELLWRLTLRDLSLRYKQAVMGIGWALFMPVLIVGAGALIKYAMAQVGGGELPLSRLASMALKSLPWAFFVGSIGFATPSLISNMSLVTKIYFPREVLPLSTVLTQAVDSLLGGGVVAIILFTQAEIPFTRQMLWVPLLVLLIVLLTITAALVLSCANLFFRDVKYIVQVILTFGIFFTPVFYEPELLGPLGCKLMMLNPIAPLLEGLSLSVIDGHNLLYPLVNEHHGQPVLAWHPIYLLYSATWATVGCGIAWYYFHKLEFIYAEYI